MIDALHDPGTQVASARAAVAHREHVPALLAQSGAKILVGIASWTDPSMTAAGVFYPDGITTPEARLRYYAGRFPLVIFSHGAGGSRAAFPDLTAHWAREERYQVSSFGARYGAKSCQICWTTFGSTTRVSPLSGSFSEYSTSLTVPHCGASAPGSKA